MIFQHIFLNCSFLEQSNALCNAFINFFLFVSWSKNHTLCLLYVYLMWHIFLYVYIYIYIYSFRKQCSHSSHFIQRLTF